MGGRIGRLVAIQSTLAVGNRHPLVISKESLEVF